MSNKNLENKCFTVNLEKLKEFLNMSKEEQEKDFEEWMIKNHIYDGMDMELSYVSE